MAWLPKSRKARRRLTIIAAAAPILAAAVGLSLYAMGDGVVFFYGPSEAHSKAPIGRVVRIGGLVEAGSVARAADGSVSFKVTDRQVAIPVTYRGDLPDLFREGQGVVTQGAFDNAGVFRASQVLAKHDERYMPPEVARALKARGEWKRGEGQGADQAQTPRPAA
ncbi:MAG: cytochrome c maturation protein CcmE [Proteobacteria bacterium]|nr:cytochrome c maturation protein CcmE [Pseudomonadota bacterium]